MKAMLSLIFSAVARENRLYVSLLALALKPSISVSYTHLTLPTICSV